MVVDKREQLTRELGTTDAQPQRRTAIRRAKLLIGLVCACICAGLIWFTISVVGNVPTNACRTALGPLQDLEAMTQQQLWIDEGVGGDRECDVAVWDSSTPADWRSGGATLDVARHAAVVLAQRHASRRADFDAELARGTFDRTEKLHANGVEVTLYLAGPEEPQHALVFTRGETATRVRLSRKLFTPDRAKTYANVLTR
ncbi:MAG: hypothetical protein KIT31_29400 [Deltaproteobacteria bacterium]|nr:hypothetical protein [Deltaproteobacteria bacterium]